METLGLLLYLEWEINIMIKIFGKERKTLTSDVDTWVVKWTTYTATYTGNIKYPNVEDCFRAFTDESEAREYARALNDAMKLLGITSLPQAIVYKQTIGSL